MIPCKTILLYYKFVTDIIYDAFTNIKIFCSYKVKLMLYIIHFKIRGTDVYVVYI